MAPHGSGRTRGGLGAAWAGLVTFIGNLGHAVAGRRRLRQPRRLLAARNATAACHPRGATPGR
jgi:hypothetical protein